MKNKILLAIAACIVGVVLGWLISTGGRCPIPEKVLVCEQNGVASGLPAVSTQEGGAKTSSASRSSTDIPAVENEGTATATDQEPYSNDDDTGDDSEDDRTTRMGIIMQQSAEEVRQAIIDNAGLDDTKIERLDKVIENMNTQMLEVSTKWADHIRETGTLDINTRMKMQHEISGVMVSVSDLMDEEFAGWRGEDTDLSRLIRVTVAFEPLRKVRSEILRGEWYNREQESEDDDE